MNPTFIITFAPFKYQKTMSTIILGIESSCDDTSAAVIKDGYLLSNVVSSQAVHEAYGGVVPNLLHVRISKILFRLYMRH